MDTSIFDNTYSECCKEIPDIIISLAKKDVEGRLFINEDEVKLWVNKLSDDSTKYDILMWLKAKANTSFLDKCSIPFTENTIKQTITCLSSSEMVKSVINFTTKTSCLIVYCRRFLCASIQKI